MPVDRSRQFTAHMPPDRAKAANEAIEDLGISQAEFTRRAVTEWLANHGYLDVVIAVK